MGCVVLSCFVWYRTELYCAVQYCVVLSPTCCMELLASMLRCAVGYDAVSWKSRQHSREPSQGSSPPPIYAEHAEI